MEGHTDDELLQKLVNSEFGKPIVLYAVSEREKLPWQNQGQPGASSFSTVPFTKVIIDGHEAARVTNNKNVYYIILNGTNGSKSFGFYAQPSDSKYIQTFDTIISTIKFTN